MRLRLVFLAVILSYQSVSLAQGLEVGLFGGGSNYNGDLSDVRVNLSETHPAFGGFLRYNFTQRFALRLGLTYGQVSESDANSIIDYRKIRNLSFRSNIYEAALLAEVNLFGLNGADKKFSPYIFGGISIFRFNPEAFYQGEWIALQPLGTEGQGTTAFPSREKYKLSSFAVPFGLGVKIDFGSMVLGLESGLRKTFTDYLDDVSTTYVDPAVLIPENGSLALNLSNRTGEILGVPLVLGNTDQRGNPASTDWYAFTGITLSFKLTNRVATTSRKGSSLDCPKF